MTPGWINVKNGLAASGRPYYRRDGSVVAIRLAAIFFCLAVWFGVVVWIAS
jgi:hypothetical protein